MIQGVRGVLIDFVGTLVTFKPDPEGAIRGMHDELRKSGVNIELEELKEAYEASHLKYRKLRHEQLIEVSNDVWIRETLERLSLCGGDESMPRILADAYFRSFVNDARMLPEIKETLEYLTAKNYRLALVSNFSYAPVPEMLLKQFEIERYFSVFAISHRIGYRKPHPEIFRHALRELGVGADGGLMVGDTLTEDVYGAKKLGIRAFQIREPLHDSYSPYMVKEEEEMKFLQPDARIGNFSELRELL